MDLLSLVTSTLVKSQKTDFYTLKQAHRITQVQRYGKIFHTIVRAMCGPLAASFTRFYRLYRHLEPKT